MTTKKQYHIENNGAPIKTLSINDVDYLALCQAADIPHTTEKDTSDLIQFAEPEGFLAASRSEHFHTALQVLCAEIAMLPTAPQVINNAVVDFCIADINRQINETLDAVLHHPEFQALEASWRGLKYLVDHTDFHANTKIDVLDISQTALYQDFAHSRNIEQSGLYHQLYQQEYDMPGGEPYAAIIADYSFNAGDRDIELLSQIAAVASHTHCPVISAVNAEFFLQSHISHLNNVSDLENYMQRADYLRWQGFRKTESARYVGLTLPRFLLRLPYGEQNPCIGFPYREKTPDPNAQDYLWGNAAFAFGANLTKSFSQHGWLINIRGNENGGRVTDLQFERFPDYYGNQRKIPTEILLSETRELALAKCGFIPLVYYKNSDYACFFSANSAHLPMLYHDDTASANARINARLPYVFLCSRIAHYLKVLQRENIGSGKNRSELERDLNQWLKQLITKMPNPDPQTIAKHPLAAGEVSVTEQADNPGFFHIDLWLMPHFQVEGIDIRLSLISRLPKQQT